jgi:anti-sigma factor RsiW
MRELRRRGGLGPHLGPLLSAFADESLSGRRRRRATAHLAACAVCRHDLSELRAAKRMLEGLPERLPPAGLVEGVAAAPAARGGGRVPNVGFRRRVLRRVTVAGAAVLALLTAGTLLAPPPQGPLDYEHVVRAHLVQAGEPSADQASYMVTVTRP